MDRAEVQGRLSRSVSPAVHVKIFHHCIGFQLSRTLLLEASSCETLIQFTVPVLRLVDRQKNLSTEEEATLVVPFIVYLLFFIIFISVLKGSNDLR